MLLEELKKSLTSMSDEELQGHILAIRNARRTRPAAKTAPKPEKQKYSKADILAVLSLLDDEEEDDVSISNPA